MIIIQAYIYIGQYHKWKYCTSAAAMCYWHQRAGKSVGLLLEQTPDQSSWRPESYWLLNAFYWLQEVCTQQVLCCLTSGIYSRGIDSATPPIVALSFVLLEERESTRLSLTRYCDFMHLTDTDLCYNFINRIPNIADIYSRFTGYWCLIMMHVLCQWCKSWINVTSLFRLQLWKLLEIRFSTPYESGRDWIFSLV